MSNIRSQPAVLDTISQSKYFHDQWENVQRTLGAVLSEAYNPDGTMDAWVNSCKSAKTALETLEVLGWSVHHGETKE